MEYLDTGKDLIVPIGQNGASRLISLSHKQYEFIQAAIKTRSLTFAAKLVGISLETAKLWFKNKKLKNFRKQLYRKAVIQQKVGPQWIKETLVEIADGTRPANRVQLEAVRSLMDLYGISSKTGNGEARGPNDFRIIESSQEYPAQLPTPQEPENSSPGHGEIHLSDGGAAVRENQTSNLQTS